MHIKQQVFLLKKWSWAFFCREDFFPKSFRHHVQTDKNLKPATYVANNWDPTASVPYVTLKIQVLFIAGTIIRQHSHKRQLDVVYGYEGYDVLDVRWR